MCVQIKISLVYWSCHFAFCGHIIPWQLLSASPPRNWGIWLGFLSIWITWLPGSPRSLCPPLSCHVSRHCGTAAVATWRVSFQWPALHTGGFWWCGRLACGGRGPSNGICTVWTVWIFGTPSKYWTHHSCNWSIKANMLTITLCQFTKLPTTSDGITTPAMEKTWFSSHIKCWDYLTEQQVIVHNPWSIQWLKQSLSSTTASYPWSESDQKLKSTTRFFDWSNKLFWWLLSHSVTRTATNHCKTWSK